MRVSNSNTSPAFGSFRAVVANEQEQVATFKLARTFIEKALPETKIDLETTKIQPRFVTEVVEFLYKITGKNTNEELVAANILAKSGIPVTPIIPSPLERVSGAVRAVRAIATESQKAAEKVTPQTAPAGAQASQSFVPAIGLQSEETEEAIAKGTLTSMHKFDIKY